jgi:FkbM family methyltransferase
VLFARFPRWQGTVEPGWVANFLGVRTRRDYLLHPPPLAPGLQHVRTGYPQLGEPFFEWVDLFEAVTQADGTFTMVELGAGYGRWLMNGAAAARQLGLDYHLIGVEGEPTHFRWLRQHLSDNGVPDKCVTLYEAAIAPLEGPVDFYVGDPASWYGQRTVDPAARLNLPVSRGIRQVPGITLATVLAEIDRCDLVDMDIQGTEADVLEAAVEAVNAKVKRVHIGTHSGENEERLQVLFRELGWWNRWDLPRGRNETPFGSVDCEDGVQTWVNPALVTADSSGAASA